MRGRGGCIADQLRSDEAALFPESEIRVLSHEACQPAAVSRDRGARIRGSGSPVRRSDNGDLSEIWRGSASERRDVRAERAVRANVLATRSSSHSSWFEQKIGTALPMIGGINFFFPALYCG